MAQRVRKRYRGQYALRLPYNSPFQQHFTQGFLLCSAVVYTMRKKLYRGESIFFYLILKISIQFILLRRPKLTQSGGALNGNR